MVEMGLQAGLVGPGWGREGGFSEGCGLGAGELA